MDTYALTIAGSDPSCGAGIQKDLEVFRACQVRGLSVITAVTSQTDRKFINLYSLPKKIVSSQLATLLEQYPIAAIKTGLLYDKKTIDVVYNRLKKHRHIPLVVDPIMNATLGRELLHKKAYKSLVKLIGICALVTPNCDEAEKLSRMIINNLEDMRFAAKIIYQLGPKNVLIKGGHLPGEIVDVFYDGKDFHEFPKARLPGSHYHGLGCRLSAAITAFMALKLPMMEVMKQAQIVMNQQLHSY